MSDTPAPSPRLVVGIDPGITGALALICTDPRGPRLVDVKDVPTSSFTSGKGIKSHVMPAAVARILKDWKATADWMDVPIDVFIEDVHAMPGQGVTSMFRFGHVAGLLEGVAAALELPVHKVNPREWQARVRVRKDPDAGRARVCQIFPAAAAHFKRKLDHNRADAALIAYAGVQILSSA